jgi:hypothetical protein
VKETPESINEQYTKEFLRKEQGTRLYLVEVVEIKEPASLTGLPVNRSAHRPAGYENKIAHMISALNPNSVSCQDSIKMSPFLTLLKCPLFI